METNNIVDFASRDRITDALTDLCKRRSNTRPQ